MTLCPRHSAVARNPLVAALRSLDLHPDHYAVFGSGALLPAGLRETLGDLYVIARGPAWRRAQCLGEVTAARSGLGRRVSLLGGAIEVFDRWPHDRPADELIDTALVYAGIRWVSLHEVLVWKRAAGRQKDLDDIRAIEKYLRELQQRSTA
jgi:hypothetical protein